MGKEPSGVDCPAIDGIIEEADDVAGEADDKAVLDAALIAAAQAVEHYEISRYGTLIAWAKQLGRNDCADLLAQNLEEEKATDKKLTSIAEGGLNDEAAGLAHPQIDTAGEEARGPRASGRGAARRPPVGRSAPRAKAGTRRR